MSVCSDGGLTRRRDRTCGRRRAGNVHAWSARADAKHFFHTCTQVSSLETAEIERGVPSLRHTHDAHRHISICFCRRSYDTMQLSTIASLLLVSAVLWANPAQARLGFGTTTDVTASLDICVELGDCGAEYFKDKCPAGPAGPRGAIRFRALERRDCFVNIHEGSAASMVRS